MLSPCPIRLPQRHRLRQVPAAGVIASLAEFEASLVRERTMSGLAAARARGRNGGRPRSLTPDKLAVAQQLYDSRTKTIQQIADVVGVGRTTLYRHLQRP
jgi:DNA invertase Pin-like site-specific DNA recombinase